MPLLPFFLDCNNTPHRVLDQSYALNLTPEDLLTSFGGGPLSAAAFSRANPAGPAGSGDYFRPWRHMASALRDIGSTIRVDRNKFQINLDVQHFAPEDITVKVVDGFIIVEGSHAEKRDEHGFVTRQFTRRYELPEGCDPDTVQSNLSSDGVLTVLAPKKLPEAVDGERTVPITQTGPIRKEVRDQTPHCSGQ